MTTERLQNLQLSNKTSQVFKSDNREDKRISTDQKLSVKGIVVVSRAEDGYINLNQLCKAGGKNFFHWKELKKSKTFLDVLSSSLVITRDSLIKYNSAYGSERANWGHPQVAINVAQWISPEFDVQVSKWVFELMTTGKVELGKEMSTKQLEETYTKKLLLKDQEYKLLLSNHTNLLKRRNRVDYEFGNVVYIISHEAFTSHYKTDYYKFGKSTQTKDETSACFKRRLSTYNTGAPVNYKVHYLLYVEENDLIENSLKVKYTNQLDPSNKEWIKGVSLNDVVSFIRKMSILLNVKYKEVIVDLNVNKKEVTEDEVVEEEKVEEEEEKVEDEKVEEEKVEEEKVEEEKVEEEEEKVEEEKVEEEDKETEKILEEINNLSKLTVVNLRKECVKHGLKQAGNKSVLIEKITDFLKRGIKEKHGSSKTVYKYDANGKFLEEYKSVGLAAKSIKSDTSEKSKQDKISDVCLNKNGTKTYKGFVWKYEKIILDTREVTDVNKHSRARVIIKENLQGVELQRFKSIIEACSITGLNMNTLKDSLRKKNKYTKGDFVLRYSVPTIKQLTSIQKDEIREKYSKGVSVDKLSKEYSKSVKQLRRVLTTK